jgi:hypothetical protein
MVLAENDYKGRKLSRLDQNKTRKIFKKKKSFPKRKVKALSERRLTICSQTESFPKCAFLAESTLLLLENFLLFRGGQERVLPGPSAHYLSIRGMKKCTNCCLFP